MTVRRGPMRLFAAAIFICGGLILVATMWFATEGSLANPDSPAASANGEPIPSLSMPIDFPGSIPVRPGPIVVSTATGPDSARTWVIEVLVDDLETAQRESVEELRSAGFVIVSETQVDVDTWDAVLSRENFMILLRVYREADTGELEVRYVVTQGGN